MPRFFGRRALVGVGLAAALAGLAISGSLAYAAAGDGPVIKACVDKKGGVRIVATSTRCRTDETSVSWNKQGPVGKPGAAGAAGSGGAAGAAGHDGKDGKDGKDGTQGVQGVQGPTGPTAKVAGVSGAYGAPGRITCTSTKQGDFSGDGPDGSSVLEAVSYNVTSPRDAATGQATGKRQHKPFTITKELDAASPKYFRALVTNETLSSCTISLFSTAGTGAVHEVYRVLLTNACVVDDQLTQGDTRLAGQGPLGQYETISFTFEKIELTDVASKTTAQDDWVATPN